MQFENVDWSQEPPAAIYKPAANMVIKLGSRFISSRLYPNFNGHSLEVPVSASDAEILEGEDKYARQELAGNLVQPNSVADYYRTPKGAKLVGRLANKLVVIAIPNEEIREVLEP
jgi:hypothetical protein